MMTLQAVAQYLNAPWQGQAVTITGVESDSRRIVAGDLFVALRGERLDGHAFIEEVANRGAVAALVSKPVPSPIPTLVVPDTRLAMGQLAASWRAHLGMPLIAVTGSNGKTTTKEMIAAILRQAVGQPEQVLATAGNFNNDIGMPLTLLKLRPQHRYAVIEMGMNHLGEIDYLTRLAKPQVALVINAGTAHIGELGSRENIAKAKGEIFAGLSADGIAVINADSPFAESWRQCNRDKRVLTFGMQQAAEVTGKVIHVADSTQMQLQYQSQSALLTVPLPGLHNAMNALAAAAGCIALGVSLAQIVQGMAQLSGVNGRLQYKSAANGARLIDDTYNANPDSMFAAIDVLKTHSARTWLVIGDMGELGADAQAMHASVGAYAKAAGISHCWAVGTHSAAAVQAFGEAGQHFSSVEALIDALHTHLSQQDVVLIKGSRFMRMERVVSALVDGVLPTDSTTTAAQITTKKATH